MSYFQLVHCTISIERSHVDMDVIEHDHEQAGGDVESESVLLQLPANNWI